MEGRLAARKAPARPKAVGMLKGKTSLSQRCLQVSQVRADLLAGLEV